MYLLMEWGLLARWSGNHPASKVHGANMGPIWGRQDPVGPHVGPMNLAIWVVTGRRQAILAYNIKASAKQLPFSRRILKRIYFEEITCIAIQFIWDFFLKVWLKMRRH